MRMRLERWVLLAWAAAAACLVMFAAPAGATTWVAQNVPLSGLEPAPSIQPFASFEGDSCAAGGWCVAVGSYVDDTGSRQGLIETLSGGGFTATSAPLAGLNPAPGGNPQVFLFDVSCPVMGWCAADGQYMDGSGKTHLLAETLDNGSWSATTLPLTGLNPPPNPSTLSAGLDGMSCPAEGDCVAVGAYSGTSMSNQPLAERLASGAWKSTTPPISTLSPAGTTGQLLGVACPHNGVCTAVGDSDGGEGDLVETLSSGTWSASTPSLAGLNPPAFKSGPQPSGGALSNVSCPSSGTCTEVGTYEDQTDATQGLIVTGGSTTAVDLSHIKPPAGSNPLFAFDGIDCDTSCTAVDGYTTSASGREPTITTITGTGATTTLASLKGLHPGASSPVALELQRMSCANSSSCVAVGQYPADDGTIRALVETIAGGSSSAAAPLSGGLSPAPAANPDSTLARVSCPPSGGCLAIGSYFDASSIAHAMLVTPAPAVWSLSHDVGMAAGGNTVTISGAGFAPGATVDFGTVTSPTVTVASSTKLTAVVPGQAPSVVDVTVTSGGNTSLTSPADRYTYAAPPMITGLAPGAGPTAGGNTVTITGTNFFPGSTVRFGAGSFTAASFVSSTELEINAPSGAPGPVRVEVKTPGGVSPVSNTDDYVYGPPAVTTVDPTSGHTHGGNTVTVKGTGFTPDATVTFGTASSGSVTFVSSTKIRAVAPAEAARTVDVTVTTGGGTSSTTAADQYTYTP